MNYLRRLQSFKTGIYSGNTARSVSNGYLIACATTYDGLEKDEPMHSHENPHISFVWSGGNLEKRKGDEIERLPGKITFYHAGEYHRSMMIANGSKHINLEIQQPFFDDYCFTESTVYFAANNTPSAVFLMLQVHKELLAADKHSVTSIEMLLHDFLSRSARLIDNTKKRAWVSEIQELLCANWDQQLTLEEMAAIFNMHPVTLSRQFHNYFSCTLGEYIRKLKIAKAIILIKSTGKPFTEIAYECGFSDQSHFIRSFKQLTGLVPMCFRKT